MVAQTIVSTLVSDSLLDLEQLLEVLEEAHLLRVVLGVVLDVLLVRLKVLDDVLLLSQLGVEELRVGLELVSQLLVWLVQELGLVSDSLEEGVVDLGLDVVVVVLSFVFHVVLEHVLHVLVELALLLVKVHHDVVVLLLLVSVYCLDLLHLNSQLSQVLDLWSQVLLSVLDFLLDLFDSLGDLLQGLVLLVVKDFFLV